jgi:hypothetical protein
MLDGQSGHQQDISAYVDSKLRLPTSKTNEEIKAAIRQRAQGVFLWVVLVVKRLNQDIDRGNVRTLRNRLDEVPDGLDALFHDTLRLTGEDDEMLIQTMQWMMYARGWLGLEQLYFGIHTEMLLDGTLERWDPDEITVEVMERFIVNCSRGLVEFMRYKRYPRMQFIHESVRDYLFGGGLAQLAPAISNNLAGASHDYLKRSCLRTLTSHTIADVCFATHTLGTPDRGKALQDAGLDLVRPFPLLDYARRYVIIHAERASEHGVNQDEFLASLPLQVLNRMHQIRASHSYVPANSITEILIKAEAYGLLKQELRPGYPLLTPAEHVHVIPVALGHAELEHKPKRWHVMDMVLKRGAVADISDDDQASLIWLAVDDPTYDLDPHLLKLLFNGGMRLHSDEMFRSILTNALQRQGNPFSQALLDHEAHFGPFTTDPLHNAIHRGSITAVKTLLDGGSDANACMIATASSRGTQGGRPDSFSEVPGHDSCLKLAQVASSSGFKPQKHLAEHLTAFQYAALIGREEIICLFLAHAVDLNAAPNGCREFEIPMYLAALLGHHTIVSQLLKDARWVTSPDSDIWHRAVCAAAHAGHAETLKILLADHSHMQARGAPPASYNIDQLPPGRLSLASYERDKLARGILAAYYRRAIRRTITIGCEETLKILLDFLDASLPQFRSCGQRTLSRALQRAEWGKDEGLGDLARILREKGVKMPGER